MRKICLLLTLLVLSGCGCRPIAFEADGTAKADRSMRCDVLDQNGRCYYTSRKPEGLLGDRTP